MAKPKNRPLTFPLSPKERSTLYFTLSKNGAFCVGEKRGKQFDQLPLEQLLAIACEDSRFSPRLLGVLIDFFARQYRSINPFALAAARRAIPTPQTLGVVGAFACNLCEDADLHAFFEIVLRDLKPAPWQYYYNSQTRPRPEQRADELIFSPLEFKKWGFWSNMDPFLKERRPKATPWKFSPESRQAILRDLLAKHRRIQMGDYLSALGHSISRQQAYLDLQSMKGVRKVGEKRGRFYTASRYAS